jgi:hypothetical protein
MNLFQRKTQCTAVTTTPVLSELELAEREVEAANERIAEVGREWRALQDEFQVTINRDGRVASAVLPPNISRDALDHLVRLNLAGRCEALAAFHRALSRYAGLKTGN